MKEKTSAPSKKGLGTTLFSSTQQKVLTLFFLQEHREYTLKELISLVAAGSGAVQRELKKLTTSNLVLIKHIGRQKFYQVNTTSPLFSELKSILSKTSGIPELIRHILNTSIDEDIELAFIYGSVAKNTDSALSDIDLLVVADELPLSTLYNALEPAEQQLGRKINPTLYTQKEWRQRLSQGNSFTKKIMAGPKIYIVGEADGV